MSKYQIVISRNESLDLVGVAGAVPAKVDSGAYRSSIHATNIKVTKKGGKAVLTCKLLGHKCYDEDFDFETTSFSQVSVTNSFGVRELRYEAPMKVKLGSKVFTTSFTLADRSNNLFPILIGRKLLKGRFLVDVSKSNLNRKQLKAAFGDQMPEDEEDLE